MTEHGEHTGQHALRGASAREPIPAQSTRDTVHGLTPVDAAELIEKLAHELRTPLTSITAFADLLRGCEPPLSDEGVEFVEIIEENSTRLLRLISDLLLLTRLESGTVQLDLVPVSVPEMIAEAVRARSADADQWGVALEIPGGPRSPGPPVPADRRLLRQLMDSLLTNAIKFTRAPGRVTVRSSYDGAAWRIDVTDSGMGIPASERDKVFDRFFRASNARLSQVPGSGLGLSMVKAITALHHGRAEIRGARGGGTTVSVWLRARP